MLHPVPDSIHRARLLEVVELQRQLLEALCALAAGAPVDQDWLQGVWPGVPAEWIGRFWVNDKGSRANWIAEIAAASTADKQTISDLLAEQLRFPELYATPATARLTKHTWGGGGV